uniref:Uncharacterized protein n=1 Tax=Biomphalaria glabrata TaxID=6526 RepID=A0A2C9KW90_BIOGL
MHMQNQSSTLKRQLTNRPVSTLSIITSNDVVQNDSLQTVSKISTEKEKKSVHFASDHEEVSDRYASSSYSQQSSTEEQTLLQSEHLYSGDTFVSLSLNEETATEATSGDAPTTLQTYPSYGSSTFISLDSSYESKTQSDSSFTDTNSFASSSVFSSSTSTSQDNSSHNTGIGRTEIVKDIEDLEESEFFSKTDLTSFDEITDSEFDDSDLAEKNRQKFIETTIAHLGLQKLGSPRSHESDNEFELELRSTQKALLGTEAKAHSLFCKQMIQLCNKVEKTQSKVSTFQERYQHKPSEAGCHILEHYGLNSAIVDRLKLANFLNQLVKKMKDLDRDIEKSKAYIQAHQNVDEEIERKRFLSQATSHLKRQNIEERITEHTMRMQPALWFADLVQGLPHSTADTRQILDLYRDQVQDRNKSLVLDES